MAIWFRSTSLTWLTEMGIYTAPAFNPFLMEATPKPNLSYSHGAIRTCSFLMGYHSLPPAYSNKHTNNAVQPLD
jgi:hypothetical protein